MRHHEEILKKAQQTATALADYKRMDKARTDLYYIQEGRATLTLQLLDVTPQQLDTATDRADTELNSLIHIIDDLVK